ncbi:ABC transporter substrate-binding protein [Cellulosilyticum sp. I15G10I2]|uniref:ABC transporter substrate-binding protein n=1 Tax=Cellulosilyticum sp. I15G10I2 TaxID=1892843 RepID=UPI00085C3606|nr:extracellular solute-binding protein [Cellulosilyticum sp. I15G10I2]
MKRMAAKLASILLAGTMLVGCGGGGNTPSSETAKETKTPSATEKTAPSADATPVELWTFQEIHTTFYDELVSVWNEQNPDRQIDLNFTVLPYDDMHSKLLIALQSGVGAPDIADIEIGKFANYLKGEPQLLPLNDVVEPELGNIVKSRVEIYGKDDKYYGICFHIGASVTYYNKEILDQAGVKVEDIVTWEDFRAAGKKVLDATGAPMATMETSDPWSFWPMLASQGGDLLKPDGSPNVDSPEFIKAITFVQEMIKEGTIAITPGAFHHAEEYYGFMNNGGAASVSMPLWYMGRFTEYMPDLNQKMVIAPNPVWEKGQPRSVGLGGTGTAVTNQAKDPQLAKDFLAFAKLSKEANIKMWTFLGFDPIRTEVWDEPEVLAPNKFTEYFLNSPFDVLAQIKDEIPAIVTGENLPKVMDALKTTTLFRAFEELEDPAALVADEQSKLN